MGLGRRGGCLCWCRCLLRRGREAAAEAADIGAGAGGGGAGGNIITGDPLGSTIAAMDFFFLSSESTPRVWSGDCGSANCRILPLLHPPPPFFALPLSLSERNFISSSSSSRSASESRPSARRNFHFTPSNNSSPPQTFPTWNHGWRREDECIRQDEDTSPPKTVRRREKTHSQDQQHPWRKKYLQHSCRRQDDTTLSFRPPRLKYCKDMNLE